MITSPGAPIGRDRVFIVRADDQWGDLFERYFDGTEWLWYHHGHPDGDKLMAGPSDTLRPDVQQLFVVGRSGTLWERSTNSAGLWEWIPHWPADENERIVQVGAIPIVGNFEVFAVSASGRLHQMHWLEGPDDWTWVDHGFPFGDPDSRRLRATAPVMVTNDQVFVVTRGGELFALERDPTTGQAWHWVGHNKPPNTTITTGPGAPMNLRRLFVGGGDGHLWEYTTPGPGQGWRDHGTPPGTTMATSAGADMDGTRLFLNGRDGRLFERAWDGTAWNWFDHGLAVDDGADTTMRAVTVPGAPYSNLQTGEKQVWVGTQNGHLAQRYLTGGVWKWRDHGVVLHDHVEYVIDNTGGPGPKLTVAVLAEGFAERDLPAFRSYVDTDLVNGLFGKDLYAELRGAFNVVRVDLVSPGSGVTVIRYDDPEDTPSDPNDDVMAGIVPVRTRLDYRFSGSWAHCWMEPGPDTDDRLTRVLGRLVPDWDFVVVVLNEDGYGGCASGPIMAVTSGAGSAIIGHELGHGFGGLSDEYQAEGKGAFTGTAFSGPNCSIQPSGPGLPWAALVTPGAPLPTDPADLPPGWDENTSVGAFVGCGTYESGLHRPSVKCRMNVNEDLFCPVCEQEMRAAAAPYLGVAVTSRGDLPTRLPGRHLRLDVEVSGTPGGGVQVRRVAVVDAPLVRRDTATGPLVYRVSVAGAVVWADSLAVDRTRRGVPRPGSPSHSVRPAAAVTVPVRIPLTGDTLPADLAVRFWSPADPAGAGRDVLDATLRRTATPPAAMTEDATVTTADVLAAPGAAAALTAAGIRLTG